MKKTLAVLLTCHNRKNKTLKCLEYLFRAQIPNNIDGFDVYLVDDGSTDGTTHAVSKAFPSVNIIPGDGHLYWNKGMRVAWSSAAKAHQYDFYLWLNDDLILYDDALIELIECFNESLKKNNKPSIIAGAFKDSKDQDKFSYGGRTRTDKIVIPNGNLQQCTFINGNGVLVPKSIFDKLGNLSADYTHGIGDFDYGLRAINSGFYNYTTKKYLGICPINYKGYPGAQIPLKKRLELFNSPYGLNYKEYITYRKKFWKKTWVLFAIRAYLRVFFPGLYKKSGKKR